MFCCFLVAAAAVCYSIALLALVGIYFKLVGPEEKKTGATPAVLVCDDFV
jgi:hypothetical protein